MKELAGEQYELLVLEDIAHDCQRFVGESLLNGDPLPTPREVLERSLSENELSLARLEALMATFLKEIQR